MRHCDQHRKTEAVLNLRPGDRVLFLQDDWDFGTKRTLQVTRVSVVTIASAEVANSLACSGAKRDLDEMLRVGKIERAVSVPVSIETEALHADNVGPNCRHVRAALALIRRIADETRKRDGLFAIGSVISANTGRPLFRVTM